VVTARIAGKLVPARRPSSPDAAQCAEQPLPLSLPRPKSTPNRRDRAAAAIRAAGSLAVAVRTRF